MAVRPKSFSGSFVRRAVIHAWCSEVCFEPKVTDAARWLNVRFFGGQSFVIRRLQTDAGKNGFNRRGYGVHIRGFCEQAAQRASNVANFPSFVQVLRESFSLCGVSVVFESSNLNRS